MGQLLREIGQTVDEAVVQGVVLATQRYPFFNLATDYISMGYQGGSVKNISQVVVHGDEVKGTVATSWRKHPLQYTSQVFQPTQAGGYTFAKGIKPGELSNIDFDGVYESGGAADRMTNGDHSDMGERSALRERFMVNDMQWIVGRGKRRPLIDDLGVGTGYEVIDVPTSEGLGPDGYLKIFDLRGVDWGQVVRGVLQSVVYKGLDDTVFDPLVEGPGRAIREHGKMVGDPDLANLHMDGFMRAELGAVTKMLNRNVYNLPDREDMRV